MIYFDAWGPTAGASTWSFALSGVRWQRLLNQEGLAKEVRTDLIMGALQDSWAYTPWNLPPEPGCPTGHHVALGKSSEGLPLGPALTASGPGTGPHQLAVAFSSRVS